MRGGVLKISVLGDSISTYTNYSNGTAANTTNSTIKDGPSYYPKGNVSSAEDTWWYKAADALDAEILVNNSWSGSTLFVTRRGAAGAYVDRCVQLHDNTGDNAGEEPDIIAIYLGTNDFNACSSTLGTYAAIDFDTLIMEQGDTVSYAEPETSMEAYAIVLDKISHRYPEAKVYCFTLLPFVQSATQPTAFNSDIEKLAEYFGVGFVDLYNCGFSTEQSSFDTLMTDTLHPNAAGMTLVANAFVDAVREDFSVSARSAA